MNQVRTFVLGVFSVILAASTPLARADFRIAKETIVTGLRLPVCVTAPSGDRDRLFVLEQRTGHIRIVDLNSRVIRSEPFLTVPEIATAGPEQGLLGLTFHPQYASNGFFYVNFNAAADGATHVRRYQVSADPNVALPGSGLTILTIPRVSAFHNAGWMDFGADGYLYIASGDGNRTGNAQDITDNLKGKILRIDVDGDDFPADPNRNYAIPPNNPFRGREGDDEIWAYGLRNPWRCSFDRLSGDLYLGDVGESRRDEIDFQPAASSGGLNYGWPCFEGTRPNVGGCVGPLVAPIHEIFREGKPWSIIGGYVYRGEAMPALHGQYFFANHRSGNVWSFLFDGSQVIDLVDRSSDLEGILAPAAFGEDGAGELYVLDYAFPWTLYKIVARFAQGDVNCDGRVDALDIEPFITALFDPEQYALDFPDCDLGQADLNLDGTVNALDIEPLLAVLFP